MYLPTLKRKPPRSFKVSQDSVIYRELCRLHQPPFVLIRTPSWLIPRHEPSLYALFVVNLLITYSPIAYFHAGLHTPSGSIITCNDFTNNRPLMNNEILDLLAKLVAFDTHTTEAPQAQFLATLTQKWGATTFIDEILPGRVNFRALFRGASSSQTRVLEAHGDTVDGTVDARYDSTNGRYYGRGACDTKGALTAMLLAVRQAQTMGRLPYDVIVASTCREESGGEGARALAKVLPEGAAVIVGEPTIMRIVRAHKGAYRTRITSHGQAAHSSTPQLGSNAIYAMRQILAALEDDILPTLADYHNPLLGYPTMSVGNIRGGQLVNVVPDHCVIEVDWRLIPGQTGAAVKEMLQRWFPDALIEPFEEYPPFSIDASHQLVTSLAQACVSVGHAAPEVIGVPWAANSGLMQDEAGIPSVIFGPGDIAQAHTKDEWIELDQIARAIPVYQAWLLQ